MGTKKEIAELVKLCSYPELQKLWRPKDGQEYYDTVFKRIDIWSWEEMKVQEWEEAKMCFLKWLPRIEDCIRLMGDKFDMLKAYENRKRGYIIYAGADYYGDKSARIACLRALKATLKGR